jgi:hypothetical protein
MFTGIFTPTTFNQTTTDVSLLHNGKTVFAGYINLRGSAGGTSLLEELSVRRGDTLDFVVGYGNGNYFNDNTFTDVEITEL